MMKFLMMGILTKEYIMRLMLTHSGPTIRLIIPSLSILSKRARALGGGKLAHMKTDPLIHLGG